jgi:hypothetical protein
MGGLSVSPLGFFDYICSENSGFLDLLLVMDVQRSDS